jgi:aspartate aminotransferase/aminotransferase
VTGWRVGYAAGPEDILSRMIRMQMFTYVCVAGPVQQAISDSYDIWDDEYAAEIYRDKCTRLCDGLAGHYNFVRPRGAFYLFAEAPGGDASAFCERAVEAGILVIPGSGFSRRDTHFRISFAVVDEIVQEATALLQDLARG